MMTDPRILSLTGNRLGDLAVGTLASYHSVIRLLRISCVARGELQAALTPSLVAQVFHTNSAALLPLPSAVLTGQGADQGGYVELDGAWWVASERAYFDAYAGSSSALDQKTWAIARFFAPGSAVDAFGQSATVNYDGYDLLVIRSEDALGNEVCVANDYRVLQPREIIEPNGNRTEAAFDALGLVVATAVKGKETEALGDRLDGFCPNLTLADLQQFIADPSSKAASLLAMQPRVLCTILIAIDVPSSHQLPQCYGVGTLAAGTAGYFIGDNVTDQIYEVVIQWEEGQRLNP